MCVAQIALNNPKKQQLLSEFISKVKDANPSNQVKGALCLGEFGKRSDVSSVSGIIDIVSHLFQIQNEDVKTAGSICLGNMSAGNANFFLQKVFVLVDQSKQNEKYLFLNTIREIITHNPLCLRDYVKKLLPLLVEQSKNEEESIRNVVSEAIGRLYVIYSTEMGGVMEDSFKTNNKVQKATFVKSFKWGASKETNNSDLEIAVVDLVNLIPEKDLTVKKNALEALNAIVHN